MTLDDLIGDLIGLFGFFALITPHEDSPFSRRVKGT